MKRKGNQSASASLNLPSHSTSSKAKPSAQYKNAQSAQQNGNGNLNISHIVAAQQIANLTNQIPSQNQLPFMPPRLVIVKQSSLAEEIITNKEGVDATVHIVVKHSPFLIQLGLASGSSNSYTTPQLLDLNRLTFECKLLYDSSGEKEVDFVKLKPLEYKVRVNESGSKVNVECRLKVLSSQLEDMFFKIKFIALDPITQREISPMLTVVSEAIKVISKPEQIKKKKTSKKTISDALIDNLVKIAQQHGTQATLLNKLASVIDTPSICSMCQQSIDQHNQHPHPHQQGQYDPSLGITTSYSASSSSSNEPSAKRLKRELTVEDFEPSFLQLMEAFENLKPEDRLIHLQAAIFGTGVTGEYLTEMIDLFSAALQRDIGSEVAGHESLLSTMEDCECPNCPHKQELKRIEDFYKEVFSI